MREAGAAVAALCVADKCLLLGGISNGVSLVLCFAATCLGVLGALLFGFKAR